MTFTDVYDKKKAPCTCGHSTALFWCGPGKNVPVLHFKPDVCLYKNSDCTCGRLVARGVGLTYKLVKTECKILRQLLEGHGFREVHQTSNDFNIMWCGCHVKPYTLRGLTELQKVNHFPRSYEITRKDRLYKNYMRMKQLLGHKHFDFLPVTFILPSEINDFYTTYQRERGYWISKPVASSRGRGIGIISHPSQINLDEQTVVCKYINKPLLVDGFKFDLRMYVAVTSFDPLRVYVFNEGLARFSTVRYDDSPLNLNNLFMHLTNYSINKKNNGYVKCSDPDIEDYGNKWSMSALLRYLKNEGYDTTTMMVRVEDLIIKTILSAEVPIANACRMFLPHRENCFELFGFDIIFDSNSKPWLLEVNLSPSLACDSPLDLKIKSNLVSQLLTLTGVVALDPYSNCKRESVSAGGTKPRKPSPVKGSYSLSADGNNAAPLSNEDLRIVRQTKEEYARASKGSFNRIFPTEDSWDLYSQFLENKTHYNFMLHSQLFPNRYPFQHRVKEKMRPKSAVVTMNKFRDISLSTTKLVSCTTTYNNSNIKDRYNRYETSLKPLGSVDDYPPEALVDTVSPDFSLPDDTATGGTTTTTDDTQTLTETSSVPGISRKSTEKQQKEKRMRRKCKSTPDLLKFNNTKPVANDNNNTKPVASDNNDPKNDSDSGDDSKVVKSAPEPSQKEVKVFDPQTVIKKAHQFSKIQAREVFSSYLLKIQEAMSCDVIYDDFSGESEESKRLQEEQMDNVIKFLKRASTNLQHQASFRVVIPSKQLTLSHRRRILAKELNDFIHIYNKETEQMIQKVRMRRILLQNRDEEDVVSPGELQTFLYTVSEPLLEDALTAYIRQHPTSSLFFGEGKSEELDSIMKTRKKKMNEEKKKQMRNKVSTKVDGSQLSMRDLATGNPTTNDNTKVEAGPHPGLGAGVIKSNSYSKNSLDSSGYGSYVSGVASSRSNSHGNRPKHKPPTPYHATVSTAVSRKAINEAILRLKKNVSSFKSSSTSDTNQTSERILRRSSVGGKAQSWSPYVNQLTSSTTTITSLPNSSHSTPPNPRLHRSNTITLDNKSEQQSARATKGSTAARAHAAKTARAMSLSAVYGGSLTRSGTAGSNRVRGKPKTGPTRGSTVSEDGIRVSEGKTAAQLKSSKSKKFVESVWTKEFCKLMDMRVYSH